MWGIELDRKSEQRVSGSDKALDALGNECVFDMLAEYKCQWIIMGMYSS